MEITVEELKSLYYNNSNECVCEYLGVSVPTLLRYLDDLGIEKKGKGGGMASIGEKKIKVVKW